jgi:hypothetical protein
MWDRGAYWPGVCNSVLLACRVILKYSQETTKSTGRTLGIENRTAEGIVLELLAFIKSNNPMSCERVNESLPNSQPSGGRWGRRAAVRK